MTINKTYMRQERLVRDLRAFCDAHPRLVTLLSAYNALMIFVIWALS